MLVIAYLAGGDELKGTERAAHVGDIGLELVESIGDVGLDLGRLLARRAVARDLVESRHGCGYGGEDERVCCSRYDFKHNFSEVGASAGSVQLMEQ